MVAFLPRWSAYSGIVTNDSADRKVAILTEALQFSTEERTAYLSRVCAGDLELRRQVDELLRSHDEAGDMLTRYLRAWDAFLHREKAKTMDRTVFDRWAKSIGHLHQKTQASQLYSVRSFLAYYAREHPTCFVPDSACFPKQLPRRFPLPFIP